MAKIRESITSNCEKKFIAKSLADYRRLDGRAFDEFRELNIVFSRDWGCCYVLLGKTRVLAQVSCEMQQPKSSRPSEGILNINVELTPMAAPHFEAGRQSDISVQLNRILEKCIKDSKAVDLESLCIRVGEKVWALRVDINVLNHEGNIMDCASIAALAALAHFRRPDVSTDGEETIVHSYAQRDPIPTVIHHYPVSVSYAIFNEGDIILADPTLLEEGVADASLIVGLNAYKELCGLHLGGSALMAPESILRCTSKAAARANVVIQQIKDAIEQDKEARAQHKVIRFEDSFEIHNDTNLSLQNLSLSLEKWNTVEQKKRNKWRKNKAQHMEVADEGAATVAPSGTVEALGKGSAVLLPSEDNNDNAWTVSSEEEEEEEEPDDVVMSTTVESEHESKKETIPDDGNSEEEDVVILDGNAKSNMKKRRRRK